MLTALCNGITQQADWVQKSDSPFTCPGCGGDLILHKGTKRIHHFAHRPPVTCAFGVGETDEHHAIKSNLYWALLAHPNVAACHLEYMFPDKQRPDILFTTRAGHVVAVELQRSALSVEELKRRTTAYTKKHLAVLWLAVGMPSPDGQEVRLREWQHWMQALYFGRLFVHSSGTLIRSYVFGDVVRYYEGGPDWPDTMRTLRRTRTLNHEYSGDIVMDFAPKWRSAWRDWPAADLWTLNLPAR